MRKHLVFLIAKYCRILKAVNRLKCGKKLRSSVFSTLNKLRHSLARLDKAMRGEVVKFRGSWPAKDVNALCHWYSGANGPRVSFFLAVI